MQDPNLFNWSPRYTYISFGVFVIRFDIRRADGGYIGSFDLQTNYEGNLVDSFILSIAIDSDFDYVSVIHSHYMTEKLNLATVMVLNHLDTRFDKIHHSFERALYQQSDSLVMPALACIMENGTDTQDTQVFCDRIGYRYTQHLNKNIDILIQDTIADRKLIVNRWLSYSQSIGYIYIVKGLFESPSYKIGYSKSPKKRIRKFEIVLPFAIETIHLIKTDHMRAAEAYLHDKYANSRTNGEWFELSEQDVADICAIEIMNVEDISTESTCPECCSTRYNEGYCIDCLHSEGVA